jgi:glycosyltransferase involved in cell wall biosynthesis
MKILFYQKSLQNDVIVSDNVHIIEVLNHLSRLGHTVIYADGKHHSIIVPSQVESVPQLAHPESTWEKVKRFVRTSPFRGVALISFLFLKEIGLFLLALITILGEKPDLIYRRHGMLNSEYILASIFKIPSIAEVNGIVVDEVKMRSGSDKLSLWIIGNIEKHAFRKADYNIVVTSKLKDTLNHEYNISVNKIIVVENGANTELFKPIDPILAKKELNLDTSITYICFVGALAMWHCVNDFISSMAYVLKEYPNVRALVIGEGSIKGELIKQSGQLGLSDKIIFTGRIPYEKVPWYINASGICVNPGCMPIRNLKIGASPLKLCEYLACGKPVVSGRLTGQEFLEENTCGFMVNTEDHFEFAQAITKLLRDPVLRQRMGENGRKYVLEHRTWESIAKKVTAVFENAIEQNQKHTT